MSTGVAWWTLSPYGLVYVMEDYVSSPYMNVVYKSSDNNMRSISDNNEIRPVIIIKGDSKFTSGTGSEIDPWIVE